MIAQNASEAINQLSAAPAGPQIQIQLEWAKGFETGPCIF